MSDKLEKELPFSEAINDEDALVDGKNNYLKMMLDFEGLTLDTNEEDLLLRE